MLDIQGTPLNMYFSFSIFMYNKYHILLELIWIFYFLFPFSYILYLFVPIYFNYLRTHAYFINLVCNIMRVHAYI